MPCQVILIGATPSGSRVLKDLGRNKDVEVQLVVTYPSEHKITRNTNIISTPLDVPIYRETDANRLTKIIDKLNPDFILVVGWSYMLKPALLATAKKGAIGFHPSRLPADKGRSALAWQISEGYKESSVTMFYLDGKPDEGDIIAQESFSISDDDYVEDVLEKVECIIPALVARYLPLLINDNAPRTPQKPGSGNYRRLRTDSDSKINWNQGVREIYNHIRAISHPYPGADLFVDSGKIKVWKAKVGDVTHRETSKALKSKFVARIVELKPDGWHSVQCRDGIIEIQLEKHLEKGTPLSS